MMKIKKMIFKPVFVLAMFFVFTAPFVILEAAETYPDNTLIQAQNDFKVYLLFNNKKRWIQNIEIFDSYDFKWSDIKIVFSEELTDYPDARLIKKADDPKVYFLENNQKRWVDSIESFEANSFDWAEIHVVNQTELGHYQDGEVLSEPAEEESIEGIDEPEIEDEVIDESDESSDESAEILATTTDELLAPGLDYFKWGSLINPNQLSLNALFRYDRTVQSQSLNVYLKYPGHQTSTKYTYQIPDSDDIIVSGNDQTSIIGAQVDLTGQTTWLWRINTQTMDNFATGTYQVYVMAVHQDGRQGPASPVFETTLYEAVNIVSPSEGAKVSPGLAFTINLYDTVPNLYYKYFIYDSQGVKLYSSDLTLRTTLRAPTTHLENGQTYHIYVDAFDNPSALASNKKQKQGYSSFVYGSVASVSEKAWSYLAGIWANQPGIVILCLVLVIGILILILSKFPKKP